MPITALTLAVVGAKYPNKRGVSRAFELALIRPGEPVKLLPEPKNKVDRRAIMVLSERDVQIGYVTAERAPWIGRKLSQGVEIKAVFQEPTEYGALIRVSLDTNDPDLPPARELAAMTGTFYPDEVYPDE